MTDTDQNRLAMHRTVLDLLDKAENRPLWEGQPPLAFTAKVALFRQSLAKLETIAREQENLITGLAERKSRERTELQELAHTQSQLLTVYFKDKNREDLAGEVNITLTNWKRFRDQSLHAKASLLLDRLKAALAADNAGLEPYALTDDDINTLETKVASFANVIAGPSSSIAGRKALTAALRPAFKDITDILTAMDKLAPRLTASTAGGSTLAAAYKAARVIRDLGRSAPTPPPPAEGEPPAA